MTYRKSADIQVFTCQGGSYITNKQLTSNVATLTTLTAHGYIVGDKVWINGVDATFNNPYSNPVTITGVPTSTTFTYAKTNTDVTSTAVLPYGNAYKAQYWTMPPGATSVKFTLCGAGGGGGSGARQATTSNRTGGGGGGGGGWTEITVPASQLPATAMSVVVPNGGYGGLAVTTDNTGGMTGGAGGGNNSTSIRTSDSPTSDFTLNASSGLGGTGGGTGATAAGGTGATNTQYPGGSGGNGTTTTGGIGTNATQVGSGGGGGGGAAASSTTTAAGGSAAIIYAVRGINPTAFGQTPGNGTTSMDATTNTTYLPVKAGLPGAGGGGGAYKTATNGGNGGDATNYCASGGGGGASDNGYNSGAGGKGADGCAVITTYF